MSRNGELREELKTLQLEKKQFLHVQSLLEKAGWLGIRQTLDLNFADDTCYKYLATGGTQRKRYQNDGSIPLTYLVTLDN